MALRTTHLIDPPRPVRAQILHHGQPATVTGYADAQRGRDLHITYRDDLGDECSTWTATSLVSQP